MQISNLTETATELNIIFNNMSTELLNKIPQDIQDFFREAASSTYKFNYNPTISLKEQKLLPTTKSILAILYRDFICTESEKEKYLCTFKTFKENLENEKKLKYSVDNIFNQPTEKDEKNISLETNLIVQEKTSFFMKIKTFFINLFN